MTVTTQGRKPKAKTPTHRGKKLGNIFTPSVQQSIATFKILLHQDPLPRLPGSFRADSISFRKSRNEHFVVTQQILEVIGCGSTSACIVSKINTICSISTYILYNIYIYIQHVELHYISYTYTHDQMIN